jgi:tRNA(Ile)-lysidine synthase
MPQRPRLTPAIADVRRAVRSCLSEAGIARGATLLVGVSGGADSMALATAAAFECERAGVRLIGVVIEHGLQPETAEVAKRVVARLTAMGLAGAEVRSVKVSGAGGLEAAAREARYQAFAEAAKVQGATGVLLGHTLDDQAETVLLGLARGSGPRSLAGMEPVSRQANGLTLLRPLLDCSRATTEQFCVDSDIEIWNDPQNQEERFARVRVRKNLMPILEGELGPGVAEALARTAELLREDLDLLDSLADEAYRGSVKLGPTSASIAVAALAEMPRAIASRVVHRLIGVFGGAATKKHVDEVLDLVLDWHGQGELTLPRVRVVRQGDDLIFKSAKTLKPGAC